MSQAFLGKIASVNNVAVIFRRAVQADSAARA